MPLSLLKYILGAVSRVQRPWLLQEKDKILSEALQHQKQLVGWCLERRHSLKKDWERDVQHWCSCILSKMVLYKVEVSGSCSRQFATIISGDLQHVSLLGAVQAERVEAVEARKVTLCLAVALFLACFLLFAPLSLSHSLALPLLFLVAPLYQSLHLSLYIYIYISLSLPPLSLWLSPPPTLSLYLNLSLSLSFFLFFVFSLALSLSRSLSLSLSPALAIHCLLPVVECERLREDQMLIMDFCD